MFVFPDIWFFNWDQTHCKMFTPDKPTGKFSKAATGAATWPILSLIAGIGRENTQEPSTDCLSPWKGLCQH